MLLNQNIQYSQILIMLKVNSRFYTIIVKIWAGFFGVKINKVTLKLSRKFKESRVV